MATKKMALGDLRFQKLLRIRAILTPEQRKKFRENHGKRGHRRGRNRGKGRGQEEDA